MPREPRVIAVFRMGHLGDTIVALPALWTVRKQFPKAKIVYLTQEHDAGRLTQGTDVLRPGTVFDEKLTYTLGSGGVSIPDILATILRLRRAKVDTLIYIPSARSAKQLKRDAMFFKLAGIKQILGMGGYKGVVQYPRAKPLPTVPNVADVLLSHLKQDGVASSESPEKLLDFGLSDEERRFGTDWLRQRGVDLSRPVVGIGPGSKMPSKLWPTERFIEVARTLEERYGASFLLFGSKEEREICQKIVDQVKHGINCAGEFTVRQSASIFEHCTLYVGNDTGTMHIAAASKVPCVAVFSARDWPGRWSPYGRNHTVLRVAVDCEGCMLETCDKGNLCLTSIPVADVLAAADRILNHEEAPSSVPKG